MSKASCYTCKSAEIVSADPSVGIMGPYAEGCTDDRVPAELFDRVSEKVDQLRGLCYEEEMAAACGCYNPRMVEKCGNCGKAMDVPLFSWEIFGSFYEDVPVCSQECKKEFEEKYYQEEE